MAAPKKNAADEADQQKPPAKGNGFASPPEFSKEEELAALRDMLLIRRFEEKAGQLYGMGLSAASAICTSARKPSLSGCRWP